MVQNSVETHFYCLIMCINKMMIWVGTRRQKLRMLFDTGSTDTWFASRKCWFLDLFCWMFSFYDNWESSTYVGDGSSFNVTYLDRNYSVFRSMDTIWVKFEYIWKYNSPADKLVIPSQPSICRVTNIFNQFYFSNKYNGIIRYV